MKFFGGSNRTRDIPNKEKGFSLVEMAIVMVIIGLIVTAVTVEKSTMQSAETLKAYQKFVVPCVAASHEGVRNGANKQPSLPNIKLAGVDLECQMDSIGQVTVTGGTDVLAPTDLRSLMDKNLTNDVDIKVDPSTGTVNMWVPGTDNSSNFTSGS